MNNAENFVISNEKEIKRFDNHLSLPYNYQILFSGKFGVGKTYFLDQFFKERPIKYEVFHLSPVNYSIKSTEDIMSFIRYDLAFQLLLNENVTFENLKFKKRFSAQFLIKEDPLELIEIILDTILPLIDKVGIPAKKVYYGLKKLGNRINDHNKKYSIDDKEFLITKLREDQSPFSESEFTLVVKSLIETLKSTLDDETETEREVILILDDLDRIDPGHIFRLFNVFASHLDPRAHESELQNKFGFDKVILVCDIINIKNVFHAQYGQRTDFNGYIDKFYSHSIFHFNNQRAVLSAVSGILSSIRIKINSADYFIELNNLDRRVFTSLLLILKKLIEFNLINLRTLLKFYKSKLFIETFSFKFRNLTNVSSEPYLAFNVLESFSGSEKNLSEILNKYVEAEGFCIMTGEDINMFGYIIGLSEFSNLRATSESTQIEFNSELGKNSYFPVTYNLLQAKYRGVLGEPIFAKIQTYGLEKERISSNENYRFPLSSVLRMAYQEFIDIRKHIV